MTSGSRDRSGVRAAWRGLNRYFQTTIWRPVPPSATFGQRTVRRASRFLYLIVRGFQDDRVLVRIGREIR